MIENPRIKHFIVTEVIDTDGNRKEENRIEIEKGSFPDIPSYPQGEISWTREVDGEVLTKFSLNIAEQFRYKLENNQLLPPKS